MENETQLFDKEFISKCLHPDFVKVEHDNYPSAYPIYLASKFTAPSLKRLKEIFDHEEGGFLYSRVSNPTVLHLEKQLAKLTQQEKALAFASGCAALSTSIFSAVEAGDTIVMFYESYRPTRFLANEFLKKFKVECVILPVNDFEAIESTFKEKKPKLCLMEATTNPITRVTDLPKLIGLCKQYHILSYLDATFSCFHQLNDLGADLIIHSLSKFAGGHGDVIAGAVMGSAKIVEPIRHDAKDLGGCLDPHAAYMVSRGIKTLPFRYQAQVRNAEKFASYLAENKKFRKVLYPFHKDHPDYEIAKRVLKDGGTVVAAELNGTSDQLFDFISKLKIFKITGSLGSVDSLVAPVELFYGWGLPKEEKNLALITPSTCRFAIGLENIDDLIADIERAL